MCQKVRVVEFLYDSSYVFRIQAHMSDPNVSAWIGVISRTVSSVLIGLTSYNVYPEIVERPLLPLAANCKRFKLNRHKLYTL
jgi:hypothetical protein